MNNYLLAEVALEVNEYYPDEPWQSNKPRAEWRWQVVDKAKEIIEAMGITEDTTDIDEVVGKYLYKKEYGEDFEPSDDKRFDNMDSMVYDNEEGDV